MDISSLLGLLDILLSFAFLVISTSMRLEKEKTDAEQSLIEAIARLQQLGWGGDLSPPQSLLSIFRRSYELIAADSRSTPCPK